jgi:hypothetical protein
MSDFWSGHSPYRRSSVPRKTLRLDDDRVAGGTAERADGLDALRLFAEPPRIPHERALREAEARPAELDRRSDERVAVAEVRAEAPVVGLGATA